jgi:hypothetical protein
MKCTTATVARVAHDCIADIGRYRYILNAKPLGRDTITRRPIAELHTLPRYGDACETVATYDPERDAWTIAK